MHPVIQKTFGGLTPSYYFRQLAFGSLFLALNLWMMARYGHGQTTKMVVSSIFFIVTTALYPYSRFVYESIVGFIVGRNTFFVNVFFMMFVKLMTMALCWAGAIFIAPIGLAYLYYHHSKT